MKLRKRKTVNKENSSEAKRPSTTGQMGLTKDRITVSPYKPTSRGKMARKPAVKASSSTTLSSVRSLEESSKVKVFIRCRPINTREQTINCRQVVNVIDYSSLIFDPSETKEQFFFHGVPQKGRDLTRKCNKNMIFEFDKVFDCDATNDEVFEATTKNTIKNILEGYNCSVFAYGATGAGKTFTMLGTEEQPGITYLTIVELLKQINSCDNGTKVTLGASYIEVYNENVRDLLHPNAGVLQLREDGGRVSIAGLVVEKINSSEQLFSLLATGNQNRSQHPTDSNSESSRSHAIFQVHIRMDGLAQLKISKLSMIDLAGSERGAATGCKGMRFKEGSNINKSLLALGNCINALADGLKHIPYRDSKLTRILKDSLGGNCQTMMIANVSPSSVSYEDTYNTLKYATRAKCIKSKIMKNVMSDTFSMTQYKKLVDELKSKNAFLESKLSSMETKNRNHSMNSMPDITEWVKKIQKVMEEKKKLHKEILSLKSQEKLNEWRLTHKNVAQSLYEPSSDLQSLNRINASISQLKARNDSIRKRIEEYMPIQVSNAEMVNNLKNEIAKNERLASFLQPTIDLYEEQILSLQYSLINDHTHKIVKLQAKQEERHTAVINTVLPVFTKYYSLLQAHGHLTNELSADYEESMKSLDGAKAVSWTDDESEPKNRSYLRLSLTSLTMDNIFNKIPTINDIKEQKVLPLKDLNKIGRNTEPIQILKSKTFIKPKSCINKENIRMPSIGTPKTKISTTRLKLSSSKTHQTRPHPYQNTLGSRSYPKLKGCTGPRKMTTGVA